MRGDERLEVLARLERRDREHVRAAEVGALAVRPERLLHTRVRDLDPLGPDAEPLDDVAARVLGVDEDEVGRARRVRVLGAVHRRRLRRHPLRKAQRHEVVDGRRADAAGLRRVHPVGVVEDVEAAEEALERGPAEPAPRVAPALRERQRHEPELDVEPVERARDRLPPGGARRRERDELVLPARRLDEPGERAADVVADAPSAECDKRRDVVDDPHGFWYSKARKRAPSSRRSPPPGHGRRRDREPDRADVVLRHERHLQHHGLLRPERDRRERRPARVGGDDGLLLLERPGVAAERDLRACRRGSGRAGRWPSAPTRSRCRLP